MRLKDRIAIVVGAGQSPGEGMGNGRATALTFAREGAKLLCVDHNLASAQETVDMIGAKGGTAVAFKADVTKQAEIKAMVSDAQSRWGRIDILHNNVGVSLSGGDAELLDITEEALDRCIAINLKSCIFAAKHVIPIMRAQNSGAIINISSMAVITTYPYVAYKATKSAMVAFTEQLAYQNAPYGIRANVILPGLMNTPMAVDTRAREFNKSRAEVEAERDAKVPLRKKMGTGWDVANAALFLASDESSFITGVTLPVDGGASVRRGEQNIAASRETQAPPDATPALDYDAIIIGAGMSGMYQLYRLRELGMRARVFEAGTGVGGTWYWNRYPGARFDSESYSYGYSFSKELLEEWDWSEHFAGQPETLRYLRSEEHTSELQSRVDLVCR